MSVAKRILAPCALSALMLTLTACDPTGLLTRQGKDVTPKSGAATPETAAPIPAGRFEVRVLTADWCGYCKRVPPLLEKLRVEFPNVRFREFDVDAAANSKLVTAYAPAGYPFFVLLDGGQIIDRAAGLQDADAYTAHIRKKIAAALAGR